MADYYEILDIDPQATEEQILAQYHFLVQAWHPDKFPAPANKAKAEEKLKQINEAKTVLLDRAKRQEYDSLRTPAPALRSEPNPFQSAQTPQTPPATQPQPAPQAQPARATDTRPRAQPANALWNTLTIELAAGVPMEFMRVPAGEFLMGSLEERLAFPNELPQHRVLLDEYLIGKYPVTNRQYQIFLEATGHGHWEFGTVQKKKENHPVVSVSWDDARAFCEWVSFISGLAVRLPSEAEWEKAARGPDGRRYPWGNDLPEKSLLNYARTVGDTSAVGAYPGGASPYGVLDMAGNAWEWVNDIYGEHYYTNSPLRSPGGPTTGEYRILRGGAWSSPERSVRVTTRLANLPNDAGSASGFRCARNPTG